MSERTVKKRASYGLFVIAAAIYMAGVVAFSFWSFFQQRTNLLAQVDQSLVHATYATEQILGDIFITCAVEIETVYELGYAANQKNLNRFAEDCHFDLLGAVGHKGAKRWALISGGKPNKAHTTDLFPDLIHSKLSSTLRALETAGKGSIQMQTVEFGECGELRVAIRYHPISADTGYAILVALQTRDVKQLIHTLAIRTIAIGVFLYAMAFPLILLYNHTQVKSARKTADLHAQLQQDFIKQKERETELEDAIRDLERFNHVAVGRETRIIELKAEVNTLLERMKQKKRYAIDHVE